MGETKEDSQKGKEICVKGKPHEFSGNWIRDWFLKKEAEGMLFAAQEQALRTNSIKAKFLQNVEFVGQRRKRLCI